LKNIRNVRKITSFKRSVKAISPVIATLLMIAIAVVASLVVYAWVSGYMGFQTEKTGKAIAVPSFAVDNSGKLHVYVQNVGQGPVQISNSYVNSNLQTFTADPNYPDNVLPEGNTADITVAGTYNAGDKLNIKITSSDGTFITTSGTVKDSTSGSGSTLYTVAVTQTANGAIAPGTGSYSASSTPSFTITPDSGYHIASITANGASIAVTNSAGQTYQFASLAADGTLTATYAANTVQYTITVTQGTNGVISPGTNSYDAGSTPSFTVTPNSGYHIASITANGASVAVTNSAGQTYQFSALSAAGTLTATYAVNTVQYQITVTQTANGVIAPGTSSYDAGSTPSFTITPNSGYHIASITVNTASVTVTSPASQTYQFAALSAAGTLTATYAANTPVTITLRPNGAGNAAELDRSGSGLTQNYQAVDEATADGTSTYVYRSSSSTGFYTDTYATADTSVTGTINYVKIYIVCNFDGGSATPHARTVLRVSGTDYYGTDTTSITSSWTTISTTYNTNPAGGNWDWATINALQSGVDLYRTSNGGTIRCTQVYLEVNYTPT
jgi:flagellin-like protein